MMEALMFTLVSFIRDQGSIGVVIYISTHVALAVLGLPCSPLTLAAGGLWGPVEGFIYSMFAFGLSCLVCFGLSWKYGRRVVALLPRRIGQIIVYVFERQTLQSWQAAVFFALNPLVPASSAGYLFGLTSMRLGTYLAGTAAGVLPMQIAYVILGNGFAGAIENHNMFNLLLSAALFTAVFAWYRISALKRRKDEL